MSDVMGIDIDDLPQRYQKQVRRQIADETRTAGTASDLEPRIVDEPMAEEEAARFNGPVRIYYTEHRKRLADSDGACTKYLTDALVSAKILADDSPKEIPERPKHKQVKDRDERTIIEIRELE